jgi:DNA repair photolyase
MRRVDNPPNRFHAQAVEWHGPAPDARLVIHEEEARSILSENQSPDLPFRYSVNPYRGCYHGCAYCYARPSHQYLDFGAGTDFERQLVVKTNAPELLDRALRKPSWEQESITFSGNTDCYQPLEASYELTRRCLEVCLKHENPVTVVTKSGLVRRDVELLRALSGRASVKVFLSIPFADDASGRAIEPGASPIAKRFEALSCLSEAGIETGVALAPLIVGLNDRMIPEILERAHAAGARHAFTIALRLPAEVAPVFEARLRESYPQAAERVLSQIRQVRGGKLNDPRFGSRMRGAGPRWDAVAQLFDVTAARLGLNTKRIHEPPRPRRGQLTLF